MFDFLIEASSQLLDLLPRLYQLLQTPLYDLGLRVVIDVFGGTGELYMAFFDRVVASGDIALILDGANIDVYTVSLMTFVLGPGLVFIVSFGVVLFVLDIVDRLIPI